MNTSNHSLNFGYAQAEIVAANADGHFEGWTEIAPDALSSYAKQATQPFTIEMARQSIGKHVPEPHDKRTWGQVARSAISRKLIVGVGAGRANSSHGCFKPTYQCGF